MGLQQRNDDVHHDVAAVSGDGAAPPVVALVKEVGAVQSPRAMERNMGWGRRRAAAA